MNYNKKLPDYFSNIRKELVCLINKETKGIKILEIGAAYGETLFYLKQKGIASEVVGVDVFEDFKNKHNYKPIDKYIFGDIEKLELNQYINYFDLILLPDVLEHLFEPKDVLEKLKNYIVEDGRLIISMPNIRHYSALYNIFFKGDFKYEESGILDYTHLRFYCKKNIIDLIEKSGFKILKTQSSLHSYKGKSLTKILNKLTFGIFEEFFSYQYFFVIKK
jgi:2-polyprenyl-3-methyl-5-hydroxy-6-metoxy-1,4-benzoquinol methylase